MVKYVIKRILSYMHGVCGTAEWGKNTTKEYLICIIERGCRVGGATNTFLNTFFNTGSKPNM